MNFDLLRPILSGLAGAAVALWLGRSLTKWMPKVYRDKKPEILLKENRVGIFISNALFFIGLFGGVAVYQLNYFKDNDWRGYGLMVGFSVFVPLVVLPLTALLSGRSPKEAFIAYAISQKTPPLVLYLICGFGTAGFFAAVTSLIIR